MNEQKRSVSRRSFIGTTTGALAGAQLVVPQQVAGQPGGRSRTAPSDTIVAAGIGIGGRGTGDLQLLVNDERVRFVAIADVQEERRERIKSSIDAFYNNNDCVMYRDAAEVMAREDIDVLLIATSDRWHAHMAIWAAQSGKDMYCEKPAAMSIMDSYALAENCNRYGVVCQSGCQRRNGFNFEFAAGLARSGKLGRLLAVHADTSYGQGAVDISGHSWWPADDEEPDPRVFDWDKWLGPCLWRPYNSQYPLGEPGRGDFWDFHAGLLEWGSHTVALAQWAADMDDSQPIEYVPEGHNFRGDGLMGPYTITGTYANGVKLVIRNHGWNGTGSCANRFEGTEGWVETGDSGQILVSDSLKSLLPTREGPRTNPTDAHIQDFLRSVRSRIQPRANAAATANTHIACHAAFIAAQINRPITWDPARREFVNDEEANRMRSRAYRGRWRLEALSNVV